MKVSAIVKTDKHRAIIVAIFFAGMIVCSRGTILGNLMLKMCMVCAVTCFCLAGIRKIKGKLYIMLACFAFFGYCLFQGLMLGAQSDEKTIIENVFYWSICVIVAGFVMSNEKYEYYAGRVIIYILSAFSISYIITFILSQIIQIDKMHITTIDYGYFYNAPVYFPFTIVYGIGNLGGVDVLRMQGFGRECGITQTFYIWGFYKCRDYFSNSRVVQVLMGLGLLSCFSTTGLAILAVSYMVGFLVKNRKRNNGKLFGVIVVAGALFILLYSGTYSLSNRLEVSFADRITYIRAGIKQFIEHPIFGIGYMKRVNPGHDMSDICLLSSIGKIGIVGILLFLLIYFAAFLNSKDKMMFLLSNSGFFITAIIAQPLFHIPMMYIMLFMDYDKKEQKYIERSYLNR